MMLKKHHKILIVGLILAMLAMFILMALQS
jgi:hypothetical protein